MSVESLALPGGQAPPAVSGEFLTMDGERYYAIRNVDAMPPFFISVISHDDHWLFVSSTGALTAGRVSPDTALFPYVTVDRIHDSAHHTGCKTVIRTTREGTSCVWEPFNREQDGRFETSRNLYKNVLGNRLCFEEINHSLMLAFRYTWAASREFGFVRQCELRNLDTRQQGIEILDGLQNLLPGNTPRHTQANASNLVDAYKWNELDPATGLAMFTLYSAISDRAEPRESLRANVAYTVGLDPHAILLSTAQLDRYRASGSITGETRKRGVRCAYLCATTLNLEPAAAKQWAVVADIQRTQAQVVQLRKDLADAPALQDAISQSLETGSCELAGIVGSADGFQGIAEEEVSAHHYANVLFNVLRGGIFDDQYSVSARDFASSVANFNRRAHARHRDLLGELPDVLPHTELASRVRTTGDRQLERLCLEYLPVTFGRRHGDPSRPWNHFTIRLRDADGQRLLSYEGNWRDIFQNWEALAFSYPGFIDGMIARFVNASTVDGYNPYRITKEGIDWEVEDADDPWSYIGYWGDHQVIYLLKLLELSRQFHPRRLGHMLRETLFCYANVPYRIRPFHALVENPKATVDYDRELAEHIARDVETYGADARLLRDDAGEVYLVCLLEKLLVVLLAKLGNLVVDGGIWLNTQRPEWNDANNALVGNGLSMVTLYYLRRYVGFLTELLIVERDDFEVSAAVADWLSETAASLGELRAGLGDAPVAPDVRHASLVALGEAAGRYRAIAYEQGLATGKAAVNPDHLRALFDDALAVIDHNIETNRRDDGLYHAYNLLDAGESRIEIAHLYLMLEGQVAVLSSGAIPPDEVVTLLDTLFASPLFRPDQQSFTLYPDRDLPGFLDKNRVPGEAARQIPLLQRMLADGDERIVMQDADGQYRFRADFVNAAELERGLDDVADDYAAELAASRSAVLELYESVFNHHAFTGRSGTMFGFEGLGCIYWHMVSKLLLAVQENYFAALDTGAPATTCRRIGEHYYRIRDGLGFNKTPSEYGAFPTDPYSHTPADAGASQPGMTGQVKEEVLTRFGELGLRVADATLRIDPRLLRPAEFAPSPRPFEFVDPGGTRRTLEVPARGLAFTWCQVPVVYVLDDAAAAAIDVNYADGTASRVDGLELPRAASEQLFGRTGDIDHIAVTLPSHALFDDA